MFSTATVPLTDGYKMRLRRIGHAMNILFGPLTTFSTHNFADTYSPLLRGLCECNGEMPGQEEPTMPTLQEMHRMTTTKHADNTLFLISLLKVQVCCDVYIHLVLTTSCPHVASQCNELFERSFAAACETLAVYMWLPSAT